MIEILTTFEKFDVLELYKHHNDIICIIAICITTVATIILHLVCNF